MNKQVYESISKMISSLNIRIVCECDVCIVMCLYGLGPS